MAGNPGQPEKPAGKRHCAGDPDRRARHRGNAMNIDDFKPAIVYTIYIASKPEQAWEALTSPEFSRKYFFGITVDVELKVGDNYIVRTPDGALNISGEVFECDPPRKLSFTFNVNWPALIEKLGPTLVTYEIEPVGEVVKLTLLQSHDRPIDDDILAGGRQGWPAILSSLKSLLETGEALVVKMAPPERMLGARQKPAVPTFPNLANAFQLRIDHCHFLQRKCHS